MNRGHLKLFPALLAGAIVFAAGLCWAQTQGQTQSQPQQKKVVEQQKQDPPDEYTEEEYDAYEKATKEQDAAKRGPALIAFMEKYPKSKLQVYIVTSYQTMLFEYSNANDNAKLEAAAEAWLKFFPNDLQTIAYVAEATRKLVRDQKFIEYGLKVYAQKPTPAYAYYLYDAYKRVKDAAKQTEWCLKLLEYPEFNDNFHLRMELVSQYAEKDLPKAAEYAQQALRALRLAKKPDNTPEAKWAEAVSFVEKECSNIIGMSLYNQGKFGEAIKYLESALKVKQYDAGYYYIAMSQWKLQQVEDAILSFAKADLMKGELQAKAKKYCEDLYRDTHNGNTTGIEKTYKKAQAELSAGRT